MELTLLARRMPVKSTLTDTLPGGFVGVTQVMAVELMRAAVDVPVPKTQCMAWPEGNASAENVTTVPPCSGPSAGCTD